MATDVVIPKLGMTMKEGTIVEWTVPDGAPVAVDDVVFVLSTEKLDTDVSAETAGILRHGAAAGECHPCSTVVGWILAEGEATPGAVNGHAPAPAREPGSPATNGSALVAAQDRGKRIVASPYARQIARDRGLDLAGLRGTGPGGRIVAADILVAPAGAPEQEPRPLSATPVARRMAEQRGVDLALITGTGPGGRITKEDVAAVDGRPPTAATAGSIPLRGMRRVIAERMHASLHEMAQLTLGMEVDMTESAELRRKLIEGWAADGVRVSFTDLVCRAVVRALADHPGLNASVDAEAITLHPQIHLGVAVAVPDGLLVPVIADAGRRSLAGLSAEAARLAQACRDATVGVDELEGATITVTALGAGGVDFFTPVINPPNVAILGIGRVHDGVRWEGDRPVRRDMMTLSLTIDHRAVDGAPGAAFLAAVRDQLESPYGLIT